MAEMLYAFKDPSVKDGLAEILSDRLSDTMAAGFKDVSKSIDRKLESISDRFDENVSSCTENNTKVGKSLSVLGDKVNDLERHNKRRLLRIVVLPAPPSAPGDNARNLEDKKRALVDLFVQKCI